jgi:YfiH family protein
MKLGFADNNELILFLSQKTDSNLRVFRDDNNKLTETARQQYFSSLGLDYNQVVAADLVHGDNIVLVTGDNKARVIPNCDALTTNTSGIILAITVADCLPLYFFDQDKKAVALAHAGWRGVQANIAGKVVKFMEKSYDSSPDDIAVFVGPHIGSCHFEVQSDVAEEFALWPNYIEMRAGKTFIDLAGIVRAQLLETGINPESINISPDCTYCLPNKYFSYRRDHPEEFEVMAAVIGIR